MSGRTVENGDAALLRKLGAADAEVKLLTSSVLVDRLVACGVSRLTAERFVEIQRGTAEPGRARRHPVSRH
jgi:hypothetical protein